jgi:hypothetical protein
VIPLVNFSTDHSLFNLNFDILYPLDDIRIYATLSVPKNDVDKNYELKFIQTTFNICKSIDSDRRDFLGRIVKDIISKISNVDKKLVQCPSLVRMFKFTNVTISENLVPSRFLQHNQKALIDGKCLQELAKITKWFRSQQRKLTFEF